MGSGFLSVGFHPLGQVCHQFQLVVAETDHVWLQVSQSSVVPILPGLPQEILVTGVDTVEDAKNRYTPVSWSTGHNAAFPGITAGLGHLF